MSEDQKPYGYSTPSVRIQSVADLLAELDSLSREIKITSDAMRLAVEKLRFLQEMRDRREREATRVLEDALAAEARMDIRRRTS